MEYIQTDDILYIGSCRYETLFTYISSTRVYTSTEAFNLISKLINNTLTVDQLQFPGSINPVLQPNFIKLMNRGISSNIKMIVIEISSRKLLFRVNTKGQLIKTTPISHVAFGGGLDGLIRQGRIAKYALLDDEIKTDLINIRSILNPNIKLVIIPHVNLPISNINPTYIPDRANLVDVLRNITSTMENTIFIDMAKSPALAGQYIETVMADSNHFNCEHLQPNSDLYHYIRSIIGLPQII